MKLSDAHQKRSHSKNKEKKITAKHRVCQSQVVYLRKTYSCPLEMRRADLNTMIK